jgi:hypothetical protein
MGLAALIVQFATFVVGMAWPSFGLYKALVWRERKTHAEDTVRMLSHFVVIVFFFTFTTALDFIIGQSFIYNVLKLLALAYLAMDGYRGSQTVFDGWITPMIESMPFVMKFADDAHKKNLISNTQSLLGHFLAVFYEQYTAIYAEIDAI